MVIGKIMWLFCYHWHWMNCTIYFAIICLNFSPLMKTSKLTSHLKGHLSPSKLIPMTFFTFLSLEEIIVKTKDELHWGIEWGFFEKKNQYFLGFVWFIVSMQCTIYGIKNLYVLYWWNSCFKNEKFDQSIYNV